MLQFHFLLEPPILFFQQFKLARVLESDGGDAGNRSQQLEMCFIKLSSCVNWCRDKSRRAVYRKPRAAHTITS